MEDSLVVINILADLEAELEAQIIERNAEMMILREMQDICMSIEQKISLVKQVLKSVDKEVFYQLYPENIE